MRHSPCLQGINNTQLILIFIIYKAVDKCKVGMGGNKQNAKCGVNMEISTCKFSNWKVLGSIGVFRTQESFRTAGRKK